MDQRYDDELDPELVAAAIRAGEKAATDEIKSDAERAWAERDDLSAQLADAQEALEKAQAEVADAKDRYVRLQADWDNFRKRTAREREVERQRASERLVENLLPAIDDLELALNHAENAQGATVADLAAGVSNVHDKIISVFAAQGVQVIDPVGEAFDPMQAQAVGRVEDAEAYDDSVAQVLRRGYAMAGKVIRPAMVTVTFGGPKRPAPEPEAEPEA